MTLVVGNPFETQDAAAALLMRTGHPAEAISFLEELVKAVPWNSDFRMRLAQARIAANQNPEGARKELSALASDKTAPYENRITAAKALAGPGPTPDLGSKELNLIASGQPINAVDANQPYFFAARLKAAEGQKGGGSVSLLRAALEGRPSGDAARVPLLKAATVTSDSHIALAVMKPYLDRGGFGASVTEADTAGEEELLDLDQTPDDTARPLSKLPAKERAEIYRDIATAFEKTGSVEEAMAYWRSAYKLETDPAQKTAINKQVQQIRTVLRRRTANEARRPLIHSDLDQNRTVRPRLPDRAMLAPPPKPAVTTGKGVSR